MMWTPSELIESLSKWDQDEPIEVHIQQVGLGEQVAIISQGTNSINLSDVD